MNPQMQNYRQYAQPQGRGPAARRPDSTSNISGPAPQTNNLWARLSVEQIPLKLSPDLRRLVDTGQTPPYAACLEEIMRRARNLPTTNPGNVPPSHHAQQQHIQQLANQQLQQRNAAMEHQAAQRRARKPTDKNLPEGVEDLVIGDGVKQYNDLRQAEHRLDAYMLRKRLEIQDTMSRHVKREKTMRIWISTTPIDQPWQVSHNDDENITFDSLAEPKYQVKIQGRLLDWPDDDSDTEDEDANVDGNQEETQPKKTKDTNPPSRPFTFFFKELKVEFEDGFMGDPNYSVHWKKPPNHRPEDELDSLTFTRKADENMNVTICLTRDETPERFKLSPVLVDMLDMTEADRAEVVMAIWDYVKLFGLQEEDERRTIRCDDNLRQLFGTETISFPQIPERILPYLLPLDPVRLPFTIRLDKEFHENLEPTVYDVDVRVEDPVRALYMKMTQNPKHQAQLRQIAELDDQIAVLVQAIHHHKARHDFFSAMAKDPVAFSKKWLASQKKDLSVILAEAEKGDFSGLEFDKSGEDGVWNSDLVKEAVRYRLAKQDAGSGR
ncbi:SWI/SNF and RSC complex subunit Ssr3 [Exophiala dermatitidis]|nr:SWI/SNF and RSC complex subunit Ssr3 [Exophiala dermatitidis]KAJ4557381.1 SWI/SNF and RSC complex subunit Ssr3 [Exophiala dermatitidis]